MNDDCNQRDSGGPRTRPAPQRLGLRQSSAALERCGPSDSGRGLPQTKASRSRVRRGITCAFLIFGCAALTFSLFGQARIATSGAGHDFKFPDYYPASNGVRQLKTLITGAEAQVVSNNARMVRLTEPRLTNYAPNGKLEWSAEARECVVNIATREVRGNSNLVIQAADGKFYHTGRGFLWQSSNSVLILSNQVFTRIDKTALSNSAALKR